MKNIQQRTASNEKMLTELINVYGDEAVAKALGVSVRSVYNYKSGSPVKPKVQKNIDASFRKLQEGAESLTDVEETKMPDIAGIQKSISEMTLTIMSQVRSQQQSSERLMSLEVRLTEIEKRLTDLANLFQSGKNGDTVPKKTEVRVTRS
jgi:hypothetical protein